MLYVTDRVGEVEDDGRLAYGHGRSPSLVLGSATVKVDDGMGWSELEAYSSAEPGFGRQPRLTVSSVTEIVRFPPTPYPFTWNGADVVVAPLGEDEEARVARRSEEELEPATQVFLGGGVVEQVLVLGQDLLVQGEAELRYVGLDLTGDDERRDGHGGGGQGALPTLRYHGL